MPTIRELLAKAGESVTAAKRIQDKADAEDRILTDDEAAEIERHLADAKEFRAQAEKQRLRDQLGEALAQGKESFGRVVEPSNILPTVPASPIDHDVEDRAGFASLGEFAMSCYAAVTPSAQGMHGIDQRLYAAAQGMSAAGGPEGGFLMPPAFVNELWDGLSARQDNLLARTNEYPVTGSGSITVTAWDETSRATGSRWGGARAYWTAEGDTIDKSNPKLREIELDPQKLAVLIPVTDKLMRNATALERELRRVSEDEITWMVNDAIVNGTGAGQPLGILNSLCLVTVAKEGSQAADTVLRENLLKMWSRLHVRARANAVWLANQDVEPEFDRLTYVVKNVAGAENVGGFADNIYSPERNTIKGRPIIYVEQCKTVGDLGDVILADLSAYASATRGMPQTAISIHLWFDTAEVAFRVLFEVDGRPFLHSAITPANGTNTLSTFIALAARA